MRHPRTPPRALVLVLLTGLAGLVPILPAFGQAPPATLTHAIAAEALSSKRIMPGVTTIDDLEHWTRERYAELHVDTWFPPMYYIYRPASAGPPTRVIQKGDVVRCDIGITYAGLTSDVQQLAYVPRDGETAIPAGLQAALAQGNRLQEIFMEHFRAGRTGNEALKAVLAQARSEGLTPKVYSHPLGFHGHAAGSRIGLPDMQDGVPGMGDLPLIDDTVWAVELGVSVPIPEWGGDRLQVALEEDAVFTRNPTSRSLAPSATELAAREGPSSPAKEESGADRATTGWIQTCKDLIAARSGANGRSAGMAI